MEGYVGSLCELFYLGLVYFFEVGVDFGAVVEVVCFVEKVRHMGSNIISSPSKKIMQINR